MIPIVLSCSMHILIYIMSVSKFLSHCVKSLILETNHLTWMGELWFFASFRIFFSDNTRVKNNFFCRAKRNFFFQNLTLGYMIKNQNQIIFFFLHQNQNIFFSNIGNQNIFLEKKHNPLPPFKLTGRSLNNVLCTKWPRHQRNCELLHFWSISLFFILDDKLSKDHYISNMMISGSS